MNAPPKKRGAVLTAPQSFKSPKAYSVCAHSANRDELQRLNGYRLCKLAMCPRLSKWEQNFIRDVSQRNRLTHRQQAIVDRLVAAYLEVGK